MTQDDKNRKQTFAILTMIPFSMTSLAKFSHTGENCLQNLHLQVAQNSSLNIGCLKR